MFKNKVGRPSNETLKKRRIIKIGAFVICIALVLTILLRVNILTNLKGDATPPNDFFTDINFYCAVVNTYNQSNGASYDCYNYVLSDDELASITMLDGVGDIQNVDGLEKLTGLEYLSLPSKGLSSIDLSHNAALTFLNLYNNNLTSIDLSNNTNLTRLDLQNNDLTSIDVSNLTNLTELDIEHNNLTTIDVSNNINLTGLDLSYNNMNSVDISGLEKLTYFEIYNNNLSELDVRNLTELKNLRVTGNNNLRKIYTENNLNLSDIEIEYYDSIDPNIYNQLAYAQFTIIMPKESSFYFSALQGVNYENENISINNGIITANEVGFNFSDFTPNENSEFEIGFIVLDKLSSEKYDVDNDNEYIYVGFDSNDKIRNNLSLGTDLGRLFCEVETDEELNACLSMLVDSGGMYDYVINDDIARTVFEFYDGEEDEFSHIEISYTLGRIDLSDYEVENKTITVDSSFNYEDIPYYNVLLEYSDNTLIVKDLSGNEIDRYTVNTSGNNGAIEPNENYQENENTSPNQQDNNSNDNNEKTPNNNNNNNNQKDDDNKVDDNNTNNINNNKTSKKTTLNKFDNAKTYDNIVRYFIICGISILLIVGIVTYTKRKK